MNHALRALIGGLAVAAALATASGAQEREHDHGGREGGRFEGGRGDAGRGGYSAPAGRYGGGGGVGGGRAYGYPPPESGYRQGFPAQPYPGGAPARGGYPAGGYPGRGYPPPAYAPPPYAPAPRPNSLGAGWSQQQEEARLAVRQGQIAPLGRIIEGIGRRTPGRQLDAGIEYEGGRPVYRVRWMTTHGRRVDFLVDAASGAILGER